MRTDNLQPVHVRQAQIEHHQIGAPLPHRVERDLTRHRLDHHVALAAQARAKETQDRRFVIHHQNPCRSGTVVMSIVSVGLSAAANTGSSR